MHRMASHKDPFKQKEYKSSQSSHTSLYTSAMHKLES